MSASATDPALLRARLERLRGRVGAEISGTSGGVPLPAASSLEPQSEPGSDIGDIVASLLGNFNVGIARVPFGLPSDVINAVIPGLDPSRSAIGSEGLQRALAAIGAAPEPGSEREDFLGRFVQNIGGAVVPFLGAVGAGARIAALGGQAASPLGRTALSAFRRPVAAGTIEAAGAAGAAGGGQIGERMAPDTSLGRFFGELVGGLAGGGLTQVAPKLVPGRLAARGALRMVAPFTKSGSKARGGRRAQSLVEDPEIAARNIESDDVLPGVSPAQRSGQPGLVALEREVAKQDLEIAGRLDRAQAETTAEVRRQLRFSGRPEDARGFLEDVTARAADSARRRLERLRPNASIREASLAVRSDIDQAFGAAKNVETRLWSEVPQDVPVPLERSRSVLRDELAGRTVADDPKDLPRFVRSLLGDLDEAGELGPGQLGSESPLKAVRTLRTRIGKAAAAERAKDAPNRNKIRVLSALENALLEDLSNSSGGPELEAAIAFSRDLNQRFRRGIVGDILGFEQTGAGRVAPESTLERALGVRGEAQGVSARELRAATGGARERVQQALGQLEGQADDTAGAGARPPEDASSDNVRDFIRSRFRDQAVDAESGRVDPRAAERFARQNRALLEEFPDLRDEIAQAGRAQRDVDTRLGRPEPGGSSATRRAKTAVATFLDAPVDQEISRVLRSQNPVREIRLLMREMRDSPEALRGLKAGFGEEAIRRAETGTDLAGATPALSGGRMRRFVNENRAVVEALYSPDEQRRLDRIVRTLERQDLSRGRVPDIGGAIIRDVPARIIDFVASTIAARRGAALGQGISGASLLTASRTTREARALLARLTNDKARELLSEAVIDEKVLVALLRDQVTASAAQKAADLRVLRAFLAAPASTAAREPEEATEPAQGSVPDLRRRLDRLRSSRAARTREAAPEEPSEATDPDDPSGIRRFLEREIGAREAAR